MASGVFVFDSTLVGERLDPCGKAIALPLMLICLVVSYCFTA